MEVSYRPSFDSVLVETFEATLDRQLEDLQTVLEQLPLMKSSGVQP
jgi:hypothetical protein